MRSALTVELTVPLVMEPEKSRSNDWLFNVFQQSLKVPIFTHPLSDPLNILLIK